MALLRKAATAGIALIFSAGLIGAPVAQAHHPKHPSCEFEVPICEPEPQEPITHPEPEEPIHEPEPEEPITHPEPQEPEPQEPIKHPEPQEPEPQEPIKHPEPQEPEPQEPIKHPEPPIKHPEPPIKHPEPPIKHPQPTPPIHEPVHPPKYPHPKPPHHHYKNFTTTHHVEGGIWKYGLRDGFWFSEYYHPTKSHTANIHVNGYEIQRKAQPGEWATARIPVFLGLPGFGYTTDC